MEAPLRDPNLNHWPQADRRSLLDEIAREGARRMLVAALETEVAAYLEAHREARWRRLDGAHLLPLVRTGITFVDGVQQAKKGRRASARAA
jgi:hypothetical protein